jgi:amidase
MAFAEYDRYDALGLAGLVAKKKISAREAVEEAIARAERLNPKLNAIVFADYERARDTAKGKLPKGPFAGVPILLKDMRAGAKGMPTRNGSRYMPKILADHDSTLVARYRAAGLIPLGKTNVPEFGILPTAESKLYGPARNPWNMDHSTGGSSGGSACAVAAGIVPIAHATDGGGSIRIPAACCGLVGLKVSRGRITQGPDFADSTSGLSVDNVVSKSVRDTAAALDASCGLDFGDPYTAPPPEGSYLDGIKRKTKRLRIAVCYKALNGKDLHPDSVAAVKKTAKLCESLGHIVEEKAPPLDPGVLTPAFMTLWAANVAYALEGLARATGIPPSTDVVEGLTFGLYDVWLNATLGAPPIKLGVINVDEQNPPLAFAPILDYVPYTAMQNATGQPAIQLPLNTNKAGLPIGVQFVARYGGEMTLLKLAAELEKAAPWADRRPNLKD